MALPFGRLAGFKPRGRYDWILQTARVLLPFLFFVWFAVHALARVPEGQCCADGVSSGEKIIAESVIYGDPGNPLLGPAWGTEIGVPSAPSAPASPDSPSAPGTPARTGYSTTDCGLARWSCEQECQKVYLATATDLAFDAAQRAKVVLGYCLDVCSKEFACPVPPPSRSRD